MSQILAMGGYAAFVWPAYAASVILLGGAVVVTVRAYRNARARLNSLEKP